MATTDTFHFLFRKPVARTADLAPSSDNLMSHQIMIFKIIQKPLLFSAIKYFIIYHPDRCNNIYS